MGFNTIHVFLNLKSLKTKTIKKNHIDHILGDTIIEMTINFP